MCPRDLGQGGWCKAGRTEKCTCFPCRHTVASWKLLFLTFSVLFFLPFINIFKSRFICCYHIGASTVQVCICHSTHMEAENKFVELVLFPPDVCDKGFYLMSHLLSPVNITCYTQSKSIFHIVKEKTTEKLNSSLSMQWRSWSPSPVPSLPEYVSTFSYAPVNMSVIRTSVSSFSLNGNGTILEQLDLLLGLTFLCPLSPGIWRD